MNRQQKEALLYAREKVERAKGYIEAVKQRRRTLLITMKAIIDLQKKYFQDGDENDLQPMVLKDVAERTQLDISTVSRVCNAKYAQTRCGTFRLRHFFSEGVRTEGGVETSIRQLKLVLQDIVKGEDKNKPMNDDELADEMKKRGFPIARRTVSKYRMQLGIPAARLRKE
jgi:RNA polymerase sigma-54 factor